MSDEKQEVINMESEEKPMTGEQALEFLEKTCLTFMVHLPDKAQPRVLAARDILKGIICPNIDAPPNGNGAGEKKE